MNHLCLNPLVGLVAASLLLSQSVLAAPLLRCTVAYAGSSQTIESHPVADPYPVASMDIGGRFRFKAVMVGGVADVDYIKLYTYLDTRKQPILVHEANYLPPFNATSKPYSLTGEQRVYAGPVERELLYNCTLEGVKP